MSHTWKTPKGTDLPLLMMHGNPYLKVAHRLVWFREECPKHGIETQFLELSVGSALARATIKDEQGRVLAVAHKYEDKQGFADFREKAETGAIGRALAWIGFGTQFCADEFDEGQRLADSPIPRSMKAHPEQPDWNDGNTEASSWKFSFGQWRQRTVEQVYNDPKFGPGALAGYIKYLEESSKKKGEKPSTAAQEAITHIESFLGAMENAPQGHMGGE